MFFKNLICYSLFTSTALYAETFPSALDKELRSKLEFFRVIPIEPIAPIANRALVELGKKLFIDPNLSGNKNISCMTCHNPMKGLSDGLPLSRTEDGQGILARNSQALFNLGAPTKTFMFWDGRVQLDNQKKIFTTPEESLNGENPKAKEIASAMSSSLAAQALFPMVSTKEMKGQIGQNEIADSKNNLEAWDKILARLKQDPKFFKAAYPNIFIDKINIGHVAEAIAAFERETFQSTDSPFYRYLRGDNSAMTEKQKRGLAVFMGNGKCIACHQGGELGNNSFFASVGVPFWGEAPVLPDEGRGAVSKETFRKYFFRTPSLLNVGLTAPYMHNGAFRTLREVINHYNDIRSSMNNYVIPAEREATMPVKVDVERRSVYLIELMNSIQAGFLRNGLNLMDSEKDDLEIFLKEALTDSLWEVPSH